LKIAGTPKRSMASSRASTQKKASNVFDILQFKTFLL